MERPLTVSVSGFLATTVVRMEEHPEEGDGGVTPGLSW